MIRDPFVVGFALGAGLAACVLLAVAVRVGCRLRAALTALMERQDLTERRREGPPPDTEVRDLAPHGAAPKRPGYDPFVDED